MSSINYTQTKWSLDIILSRDSLIVNRYQFGAESVTPPKEGYAQIHLKYKIDTHCDFMCPIRCQATDWFNQLAMRRLRIGVNLNQYGYAKPQPPTARVITSNRQDNHCTPGVKAMLTMLSSDATVIGNRRKQQP